VGESDEEAFERWKAAAKEGDAFAAFNVGLMYATTNHDS
jgi:TPR repeat protein